MTANSIQDVLDGNPITNQTAALCALDNAIDMTIKAVNDIDPSDSMSGHIAERRLLRHLVKRATMEGTIRELILSALDVDRDTYAVAFWREDDAVSALTFLEEASHDAIEAAHAHIDAMIEERN